LLTSSQICSTSEQCESGNCVRSALNPNQFICCLEGCSDGQYCRADSLTSHTCLDCIPTDGTCPNGCGANGQCNPGLAAGTLCTSGPQCASESCVEQYADGDNDEYAAAGATPSMRCSGTAALFTTRAPVGNNIDCLDTNINVNPGQTREFTAPVPVIGGFDYNCDGDELSALPARDFLQDCSNEDFGTCTQRGSWASALQVPGAPGVPACGQEGYFSPCIDQFGDGSCSGVGGGPATRGCL
jgi:hypothetical protein